MTEPTELKTERLLLRPYSLKDVDDVFEYRSDAEWARYLPHVPDPYTHRAAEESVARYVLESWETHPTWAIVLDRKVIGQIVLTINVQNKIGELGYTLSRAHWGKGLTVEAARTVIDWGFEERQLEKLFAQTDARNGRSIRVMEKLDMTREGILRSHVVGRGERIDEVSYGILREEWQKNRGR